MKRFVDILAASTALTLLVGLSCALAATVVVTRSSVTDFMYRGTLSSTEAVDVGNWDGDLRLQYVTTLPNGDFEQGWAHWTTSGTVSLATGRGAYTGQSAHMSTIDNVVGHDSYITSDAFIPTNATLTYWARKDKYNGAYQSSFKVELYTVDNTFLADVTPTGVTDLWQQYTVSVYRYMGLPIRIRFYGGTLKNSYSYGSYVDQVGGATAPHYATSGTWTSADIIKPVNASAWGSLQADMSVPSGTSVTFDVLTRDGAAIAGFSGLAAGASIVGLPSSTLADGVKIRANLQTSNTAATPSIHSLSLTYVTGPDSTKPSTVSLTATAIANRPDIRLDWQQPATDNVLVDHYAIYRDTSPFSSLTGMQPYAVTKAGSGYWASYVDKTPVTGTAYYYAVTAVDLSGNAADISTVVSATSGTGTVEAKDYYSQFMLWGDYQGLYPPSWDDKDSVYAYCDDYFATMVERGMDWITTTAPAIGWEPVLRAAAEHNIKVLLATPIVEDNLWIQPTQAEMDSRLKGVTAELQGYPALVGYRLGDEPNSISIGSGMLKTINAIYSCDPYHASAPCWWWRADLSNYLSAFPASAPYADCYMNWINANPPIGDFLAQTDQTFSDYLEILHSAATQQGGKPMWFIDGLWKGSGRGPAPEEVRCSSYLMLAHGVSGIQHFRWLAYEDVPGVIPTLQQVTGELRTITDQIGNWKRTNPIATVDGASTANFMPEIYSFQDKSGRYYVAYVNKNCTTAQTLTIHISGTAAGLPQNFTLLDLRSGDTIPYTGTSATGYTFTDTVDPGDGKVVLLDDRRLTYEERVLSDEPIGYWKLDETSGTTAANLGSSGPAHNLTYTSNSGAYTLGQTSAHDSLGTAVGFENGAGAFDASWGSLIKANDQSVEFWFKMTGDANNQQRLVSTGDRSASPSGFDIYAGGTMADGFTVGLCVYGVYQTNGSIVVQGNTWNHVVMVQGTDGVFKLYVNGQLDSVTWGPSTIGAPASGLALGYNVDPYPGDRFMDGELDEVAWYDHALTDAQIEAHYQAAPGVATLAGHVNLQDYHGSLSLAPVQVMLLSGGVAVAQSIATLDPSGNFSIDDVPDGTYDVAFKACKWLRKVVSGVGLHDGQTTNVEVSLKNGDLNGDNVVSQEDLNVLLGNLANQGQ